MKQRINLNQAGASRYKNAGHAQQNFDSAEENSPVLPAASISDSQAELSVPYP